jgi:hypothetical protein
MVMRVRVRDCKIKMDQFTISKIKCNDYEKEVHCSTSNMQVENIKRIRYIGKSMAK